MSETTQYKPGDIANGHVLGQDGIWHPAQQPMMQPPMMQPPAPKKSVWVRWYMIAAYVVVALMIVSALSGGGDDAKATDQSDTEPAAAQADGAKADKPKAEPKAVESKEEPTSEEPAEPAFDLAVNAGKLIKDYEGNELAADQRYDGKTLKVTGIVDKIDTDIWDDSKYILNLTDGSEWAILSVGVEGLSAGELAKVNTGDTVTVIAEFDDGGDLGVILKDGHLV